MISFEGVALSVLVGGRPRQVLEDCDFRFADPRMLVLAADPLARSAVLGLATGHAPAQRGRVRRSGRVSWAISALGPFRSALSGRETIGFFCGVYGLRRRAVFGLVGDMLDPGVDLDRPVIKWPAAEQIQLGYTLALAPDFDIYVMDGPVKLADPVFDARWRALFDARVATRQLIVATAQVAHAPKAASVGALLEGRRLRRVTDVRAHLQAIAEAPLVEALAPAEADDDDDTGLL